MTLGSVASYLIEQMVHLVLFVVDGPIRVVDLAALVHDVELSPIEPVGGAALIVPGA